MFLHCHTCITFAIYLVTRSSLPDFDTNYVGDHPKFLECNESLPGPAPAATARIR